MTFRMSVYLAVCILLVMESLLPCELTQTLGTEHFGGWAKQTKYKPCPAIGLQTNPFLHDVKYVPSSFLFWVKCTQFLWAVLNHGLEQGVCS